MTYPGRSRGADDSFRTEDRETPAVGHEGQDAGPADHEQGKAAGRRDPHRIGKRLPDPVPSPESPCPDRHHRCKADEREQADKVIRQHGQVHERVHEVEGMATLPGYDGEPGLVGLGRADTEQVSGVSGVEHEAPRPGGGKPDESAADRGRESPAPVYDRQPDAHGQHQPGRQLRPEAQATAAPASAASRRPPSSSRHAAIAGNDAATRSFRAVVGSNRHQGEGGEQKCTAGRGALLEPESPRCTVDGDEDREFGEELWQRIQRAASGGDEEEQDLLLGGGWKALIRTVAPFGIQ